MNVRRLIEEIEIKDGAVNVFESILSEVGDWRSNSSGCLFPLWTTKIQGPLRNLFQEEVLSTLSSLSGDKAAGSDGLIMAFWQFC